MATNFAALEARVNTAVLAHLANATADFGGVTVDGFFDAEYGSALNVISGSVPMFEAGTDALAAYATGAPLTINGVDYLVAEPKPDGRGMTRLILELA